MGMKLAHKLTAGAFLAALLIWVVGLYAVAIGRRALEDSIEHSSTMLAANLMNEVDRAIHAAIDDWLIYSAGPLVQRTLKASNQEFEKLQDVQAHIDRQEEHWRSVPKETVTAFMKSLLTSELSEALRIRLDAFERDEGYMAYGEVFLTNRYGANAAQTGKTTDYRQDDEQWWQRAREDGVYVADVQYDESAAVYSTDICVRVDDENGDFLGVIKAVFDIEGIFAILRSRTSGPQCRAGSRSPPNLTLLTAEGKVIFPPHGSSVGLLNGSSFLQPHDHSHPRRVHADHFHRHDERLGEMIGWRALSRGHDEFKGLGWALIVEHRAEDILAPVAALRRNILMISVGVTVAGLALGLWFSISMSRRITRLRNTALRVGRGELNTPLGDKTADEIGEFSRCFDRMTQQLSETLVSKTLLEDEVADRTRAGEALRHSETEKRAILDAALEHVILHDASQRVVWVNESAAESAGMRGDELIGKHCYEIWGQRHDPCPDCPVLKALETGQPHECEQTTPDGRVWFVRGYPLRGPDGEITGAVEMARDISERKRAEEKLTAANHILGERVKELSGLYELSRIAERPEISARQVLRDAVALLPPAWQYPDIACGRIRFDGEVFETHPGAKSPWCQTAAIRVGGQERGSVKVCYLEEPPESDEGPFLKEERALIDALAGQLGHIMQRKAAEEALARSNAELEQFAQVASHDLQEPLRMVTGYVKMLERRYKGQLDADADDFIHFAVDGAQRMAVLINDLLAYSRVTTRGKDLAATDCEAVMDGVLANLEVAVTETGATVTHDPLPTVVADEVQLGRLLQNLIGNAIKYHGEEPPRVHIWAERTDGMWQFAVRDNGVGIEPQYHERIFAIFKRLHARDEYKGTGIGLAIAKKIVERHGGRIRVESQPGKGSTFYFTVQQTEAETDDESSDHAADEVYANAGQTGGGPPG